MSNAEILFNATPPPPPKKLCTKIHIQHGVAQQKGQRQSMEDTHFILDAFDDFVNEVTAIDSAAAAAAAEPLALSTLSKPSFYFGLFDGHAGRAAAEFCERHLHRNIALNLLRSQSLCEAMVKGFVQTDSEFIEHARVSNEESGSVAVSLIISQNILHIAHAGDARAVICRAGRAVMLTEDHKPTVAGEKIRVEKSGGTVEYDMLNGFLEVSRAFGDFDRELQSKTRGLTALPDTGVYELTDEDEFIIVACDGLWDVFQSDAAINFAKENLNKLNYDVQKVCDLLVEEALRRHSDDNITVMLIQFSRTPPPLQARIPGDEADVEDFKDAMPKTPSQESLAQRPRFCPKGLGNLQDLLHS